MVLVRTTDHSKWPEMFRKAIKPVGLDVDKKIFGEMMRKEKKGGGKMGEKALRYWKNAYDIIKIPPPPE